MGGEGNYARILCIHCKVDVKIFFPLRIKVDSHFHDVGSDFHFVLLLSGPLIVLEAVYFLNVVAN